ncbi:MAG: hypothetical protein JXO22_05905 [Phycisphaerae bacterium]|nr:hypothetical protein [Phycisphaerae bacterium]
MRTAESIIIAKRDGSLETFSTRKLSRVLVNAMRECGQDQRLAEPIVRAVEVHLEYREQRLRLTAEYVYRCLVAVLEQTGLRNVAERLIMHRRWRRYRRSVVRVAASEPGGVSEPWRKGTIINALEESYNVGSSVARILAGELETRVLNLGHSRVSRGLLKELIRTELSAWGLRHDDLGSAYAAAEDDA